MIFRLTSRGKVLSEITVDDEEQVIVEREDATSMVGLTFDKQGGMSVGHWPDGEIWREILCISPSAYRTI